MKKTILLAAVLALALSAPAFAADAEYKSETSVKQDSSGDMKADSKTTATDTVGTTTTNEKEESVDRDSNGDYVRKTETTSKRDPKGLFNSKKRSTKDVVKKKGHKVTTEHVRKENGDTVEDEKTETDTSGQ